MAHNIALQTEQLEFVHSLDQLRLLDDIDELRSQGISQYVALPQLVVCGDQSSGKSSSLEAISGIPFPTKDNLCTRFATEVILRRTSVVTASVAIVPSQTRSESERAKLLGFRETIVSFKDFPSLVERAKAAMGVSIAGNAFSNDILRVEVSGPDRPHLTIVDLPGLIHSENKIQTTADVELVVAMARNYMQNSRSIILAVVSAKNDYANQIVLKMAREFDPTGLRTMGVITKPDDLPVGSESELAYINLARNEDICFRLGWHVLRNRDYESRDSSKEARDLTENNFFNQGVWRDLPRGIVGIHTLRERLSKVLLEQIKIELPSLIKDISSSLEECQTRLSKMGESRVTIDQQRLFLLRISQDFQSLSRAAVDGIYGDPFFEDARSKAGYSKRLRAVVQNLNQDFAESMRVRGHFRHIVDDTMEPVSEKFFENPYRITVSRSNFIEEEIQPLLKRSRGRELPGMFNPLIVGELFHEQAKPWEELARNHLRDICNAVRAFLELAVTYLTDEITSEAILRELLDPLIDEKTKSLDPKLDEILAPHQKGHPITYNHYFTDTVQKIREERLEKDIETRLLKYLGLLGHDVGNEEINMKNIKKSKLVSALSSRDRKSMDTCASSEALDCMEAYYKVAIKTFIDNVAVEAVEALIVGLPNSLSPSSILQMDPGFVSKIAAESTEDQTLREQLSKKAAILEKGLATCKRYVGRTALISQTEADRSHADEANLSHLKRIHGKKVPAAISRTHVSGDRPETPSPPEVEEPLAEDSGPSLRQLDGDPPPQEPEGGAFGQPARKGSDSAFRYWGVRQEKAAQSPTLPEEEVVTRMIKVEEPEFPYPAEDELAKIRKAKKGKRKSTEKADGDGIPIAATWGEVVEFDSSHPAEYKLSKKLKPKKGVLKSTAKADEDGIPIATTWGEVE